MATVAFPSDLYLDRSTTFKHDNNVVADRMSDGTPRQRTLSGLKWVSINCSFSNLFASEKTTLVDFLADNAANSITWTIDGVDYSGIFQGGYAVSMTGRLFNVDFLYYATAV